MITQTDKIRWVTDMDGDWLKIKVKNPRTLCENLRDGKVYDVEIKLHREKRSLDANSMAWALIGKLAVKLGIPKDDVYREIVRQVGAFEMLPVRADIAERFPSIWGANGIGFITEEVGPSRTLPGYIVFRCYYGSHVYNTKEMSRLIDYVIDECKAVGIETLPPDKINAMMKEWDRYSQGDKSKVNQPGG